MVLEVSVSVPVPPSIPFISEVAFSFCDPLDSIDIFFSNYISPLLTLQHINRKVSVLQVSKLKTTTAKIISTIIFFSIWVIIAASYRMTLLLLSSLHAHTLLHILNKKTDLCKTWSHHDRI
jgi:hypothetical protein